MGFDKGAGGVKTRWASAHEELVGREKMSTTEDDFEN